MKKVLLTSILLLTLLTGCEGYETGETTHGGAWKVIGQHGDFDLVRDTNTGCVYLQSVYNIENLTPYYNAKGEVEGCGDKRNLEDIYE